MSCDVIYFGSDGKTPITSEVTPENGWILSGNSAEHPALGLAFSRIVTEKDGMTEIRIPRDSLRETGGIRFKAILPDVGTISGREGDGSALIFPQEHGYLCRCENKASREFFFPIFNRSQAQCTMALCGVVRKRETILQILEDGRFDAEFRIRFNFGLEHLYSMDAAFLLRDEMDESLPEYDCVLRRKELAPSWQAAARFYREYVRRCRGIRLLSEKLENNPVLQYAVRAINVRFRMGVKRLPCPVPEQTPETEPPMTVFMTFDMVGEVAREMHRQQVGPAELNMVGWHHGGHDGAFPKLFPVDPHFGGEKAMVRNIRAVAKLGYPVSLHDEYTGAFSLAAAFGEFDMNDVARRLDGSMLDTGELLAGGLAYRTCPKQIFRYAKRNFDRAAKLPIRGSYYCDVSSIITLHKCHHPDHPASRAEAAACWEKLSQMQHDYFGSSWSEGAKEFAFPGLDRAYLVGGTIDRRRPNMGLDKTLGDFDLFDEEIPFFELAYHGTLTYNSYRESVNAIRGETVYLRNFAYGGTPLFYYHCIFNPEWCNKGYGWDNDRFRYTTRENLHRCVAWIKEASDDNQRVADLQTAFIDDYLRHGDNLTQTLYSNGRSVWVNYADSARRTPSGQLVPPRDFLVE